MLTEFIALFAILVSYFYVTNTYYQNLWPQSAKNIAFISLAISGIFIVVKIVLDNIFDKQVDKFLFEVTPNKPKCCVGFIGQPHKNFDYMPDSQRMNEFGKPITEQETPQELSYLG